MGNGNAHSSQPGARVYGKVPPMIGHLAPCPFWILDETLIYTIIVMIIDLDHKPNFLTMFFPVLDEYAH